MFEAGDIVICTGTVENYIDMGIDEEYARFLPDAIGKVECKEDDSYSINFEDANCWGPWWINPQYLELYHQDDTTFDTSLDLCSLLEV